MYKEISLIHIRDFSGKMLVWIRLDKKNIIGRQLHVFRERKITELVHSVLLSPRWNILLHKIDAVFLVNDVPYGTCYNQNDNGSKITEITFGRTWKLEENQK